MRVDKAVGALLDRFLARLRAVEPAVGLVALWLHGSLALGDFQAGRSDLDLIAVVDPAAAGSGRPGPGARAETGAASGTGSGSGAGAGRQGRDAEGGPVRQGLGAAQERALAAMHARFDAEEPLAAKLHCSYVATGVIGEQEISHPTWAHRSWFSRPVTAVTRRELRTGDRSLHGPPPGELLPAVSDAELAAFVRADLRTFWLPATRRPVRWLQDVWVDAGPLTVARATVTLEDGRLITKGEALDVLLRIGAPPWLVADIRGRRYERPLPLSAAGRVRRAQVTRAFTRARIRAALALGEG